MSNIEMCPMASMCKGMAKKTRVGVYADGSRSYFYNCWYCNYLGIKNSSMAYSFSLDFDGSHDAVFC